MVDRLEDAARREEGNGERQQREERRRRLEEEDRRKIAQSKKDSHEQLTQVISAWSKAVALENFFRGVEERATLLRGNETQAVLDRLKLVREFVGSHDPLEFFYSGKLPSSFTYLRQCEPIIKKVTNIIVVYRNGARPHFQVMCRATN